MYKKQFLFGIAAVFAAVILLFTGCDLDNKDKGEGELYTYTVAFNSSEGSAVAPITGITPGGTVKLPAIPTKAGFTFGGWYTRADGEGTEFTESSPVTKNITVYAKWTANPPGTYTVTFNNNGGDTQADPQYKTVISPETTIDALPGPPTWTGYTFMEWNTTAAGDGTAFTESTPVSADITVYAKWQLNPPGTYIVTFNSNGGDTQADPQSKTVISPATNIDTLPGQPTRTGYTFIEWNTTEAGDGTAFTEITTVLADIIVYAQWVANVPGTYIVTFNNNGGDTQADPQYKTVISPETTIDALPGQPTRAGYTFTGWFTTATGGTAFTEITTVSANIIVYAKWQLNVPGTYTVTFNNNGGNTQASPQSKTVTGSGSTIDSLPGQPTKTGYTFVEWNTSAAGTGTAFTEITTVSADIIVYAKWQMNSPGTYTVTFNKNGGDTEASPQTKTVTGSGSTIDSLPGQPTRTGYTFVEWNTATAGTGTAFTASTPVSVDIIVYAKWQMNSPGTYTVTFNKNGGDTEASPQTKTVTGSGSTIDSLPGQPTRTGYTFVEWNTAAAGTGTAFTASTPVSVDIIVYAKWQENVSGTYTVTFNKNGGDTEASPQTITVTGSGSTIDALPSQPTRAGHTFVEWNTVAAGTGATFNVTTPVTVDITVYAQWTATGSTLFTVNFNGNGSNGGSVPAAMTQTSTGEEIMLPGNTGGLVKTGFTFAGWTREADTDPTITSIIPIDNVTVYAQWLEHVPGTYTVSFDGNGSNGGSVPAAITQTNVGLAITLPGNTGSLVKTGYTFAGWTTVVNTDPVLTSITPSADITVYARWRQSYTVDFNDNGGSGTSPDSKTVSWPETSIDALPTPPTQPGYAFTGWNTSPGGGGTNFTASTPVTADIWVYAQWFAVGPGQGVSGITLRLNDQGAGAFSKETFTVVQNGTPPTQTITLLGTTWTSNEWRVDNQVRGTGAALTVNAADYTPGGHTLRVTVIRDGVPWTKTLNFTVTAAVSGVSLNKTSLNLPLTGTETLTAIVAPANAANRAVSWSSSDESVATVNSSGLVTAHAVGTATITVTTADGGMQAACTVTVKQSQGITLSFTDQGAGIFSQGTFTVTQNGATDTQAISLTDTTTNGEWRVDNQVRLAAGTSFTVNADHYTPGGHTLRVTVIRDGVPWTKTLNFMVTVAVANVSLNKTSLNLPLYGTETLSATVTPANAANQAVSWSSSDESVATVSSSGLVTAHALGTATITVTTADGGMQAACTVTVKQSQGITLSFTDEGSGAFSQETFTISKSGAPMSQAISVPGPWISVEWRVDNQVRGIGTGFTVNAADYTAGGHTLSVTVTNSSITGSTPWTKKVTFTVTN
ncbi:hypothetical protein AGMMS4952_02530 [Spirochaetia bacterium]|nr:hypothetical protein AGMMS4952_02530 [Spirochaetia bacterium]